MTGCWEFNKSNPSDVTLGVTQRDQFNNDDVGLADALVREVVQNSSDAGFDGACVKVCFQIKSLTGGEATSLRGYFKGLEPHLAACGMSLPDTGNANIRVLTVEDFNTRGLTGSFEQKDKGNFDRFWRTHGESEKTGQKGGRWGLGKLVYSSSSYANAFFGLTVREGDEGPSMMGQAVLANHSIGEHFHPAHGFWFDGRSENHLKLQLPVRDTVEIGIMATLFGLTRKSETGLSVAIPYIIESISKDSLISGVVNNYYFPILAGKLEVEVGDIMINANTFLDVASKVQKKAGNVPFSFIKEISDAMSSTEVHTASASIGDMRLSEKLLSEEQMEAMKSSFAAGSLVHFRVPVTLHRKNQSQQTGSIDLFIKALAEDEAPFSLFARGPITLPGERHFTGAVARGAMIANEGVVATFLGDAENPAHTGWNSNAEKLRERWDGGRKSLASIRHALRDLYSLIADQQEVQDDDVLIDFFSLADKTQASKGKRKRVKKPKPDIEPREKAIRIVPVNGGFEVHPGPGASHWQYPKRIRLRMAYDMIGANPFKRYSKFDFDLTDTNAPEIETENGNAKAVKSNILHFDVTDADFRLRATGFDTRRDLIVDARAV